MPRSAFNQISMYYLYAVILLAIRFLADLYNLPLGFVKNDHARIADGIEFFTFYFILHYAFSALFRSHRLSEVEASRFALWALLAYSFLHLLEYFFYTGGRTSTYPPAEHFFRNFISFFMLTGDAGFWQIVRIFTTGLLIIILLRRKGKTLRSIALSLWIFYVWAMLSGHPGIWIFLPVTDHEITVELVRSGILTNISASYGLLFLTFSSYYDFSELSLKNVRSFLTDLKPSLIWSVTFFSCMLFSPALLPAISISKLFLATICMIIMDFSTNSVLFALQSWKIIPRPGDHQRSNLLTVHPQIIAWLIAVFLIGWTINSGIGIVIGYMIINAIQRQLLLRKYLNQSALALGGALIFSLYFLGLFAIGIH